MKKQLQRIFSGNPVIVTAFAVLCILLFQFWWLRGDYLEKKQQLTDEVYNKLNAVVLNENLRETNRYLENVKSNKLIEDLSGVIEDNFNTSSKPKIYIYTDTSEMQEQDAEANQKILEQLGLGAKAADSIDPAAYKRRLRHQVDSVLAPLGVSYTFTFPAGFRITDQEYVIVETPLLVNNERFAVKLQHVFRTVAGNMLPSALLSLLYLSVCLGAIILLNRSLNRTRGLLLLKRNFTNNMTHELKTPLATIYAATESLDTYNVQQDPVMAKEYLGFIRGELDRLSRLIDTILVFAQLENDKIILNRERFRFAKLVSTSVARMQPRLDEQHATIDYGNVPDEAYVRGDVNHLTNVFTNLIDNALKYASGPARIVFSAEINGNALKITFADNGIGIPEKHLRNIFDPYFRVPEADNNLHSVKGYGLGLNYVRQIVQLHGGKIRVASAVGKGTTFTITLPLSHE